MLRIIGGSLKGRKLHSVRGMQVRPTADRLRESIFNILSFHVQDAIVLDLFAGTGAFGIEAISRGAQFAVFIDYSPAAVSVIARNIQLCRIDPQTKIMKWNIRNNLNCIQSFQPAFNLVFMDPPYNRELLRPALFNLQRSNALQANAGLVIEHAAVEPFPQELTAFELRDQRKYGKTLVSFSNYVI